MVQAPAFRVTQWLFFSVVLLFPVLDLLGAYLYHISGFAAIGAIRYYRDGVCLMLATFGFCNRHLPYQVRLSAGCYVAMIAMYSLASVLIGHVPVGLIVNSLGTLIIPVSLTLASFAAIREAQHMRWLVTILTAYGVASALFGIWEVQHTTFWTETVELGDYMRAVKHIESGFQPDVPLPWNFVGYQGVRRAAGLLAAPLAQGFFLAVVGLVAFAYLRGRSLMMAALVMLLCFYGVQMSGTRGALLAVAMGAGLYFLYPRPSLAGRVNNALMGAGLVLVTLPAVLHHFLYTVKLEDRSTAGHISALAENIHQLSDVVLLGFGVGAAGAQASAVQQATQGGGEGAFFSIAYQLGIPGACFFLWFLGRLFLELFSLRRRGGISGEIARALAFLFLGVAASMFTSEHILTFSGMGAFWFLVGGYLGYARRNPPSAPEVVASPA